MIKILKYGQVAQDVILAQPETAMNIEATVADIIYDVRKRGDAALYDYCKRFDKAELTSLAVTQEEINAAVASVEPKFLSILEKHFLSVQLCFSRRKRPARIRPDAGRSSLQFFCFDLPQQLVAVRFLRWEGAFCQAGSGAVGYGPF